MLKSTRTPYGTYLNLCKQFNVTPSILSQTTLNEKFNVLSGVRPSDLNEITTKYIGIGNSGLKLETGAIDNITRMTPVRRKPNAGALYNHIPFIMREVGSDLTELERRRYRMSALEVYDGVEYHVYYLRALEEDTYQPVITTIKYDGSDTPVISDYIPGDEVLNPTHPVTADVNSSIRDKIAIQIKIEFKLTEQDIAEIRNACEIIFGDTGYATVSEIGLFSGVDMDTNVVRDAATVTVTEAVVVQLAGSLTVGRVLDLGEVSGSTTILVGGVDALIN
jgi:hypothetical protein